MRHIVVIYAENRSFANLYGDFPGVRHPLSEVRPEHAQQLDRDGKTPLPVLPKIWGRAAGAGSGRQRYAIAERDIDKLTNAPFLIKDAQGNALPNGVITRDQASLLPEPDADRGRPQQPVRRVGRFGRPRDGSLPQFGRHAAAGNLARQYTLCDNFFMAAFGGSWMNHMFLISAQPPLYPDAHKHPHAAKLLSKVEGDDPTGTRLKLADIRRRPRSTARRSSWPTAR